MREFYNQIYSVMLSDKNLTESEKSEAVNFLTTINILQVPAVLQKVDFTPEEVIKLAQHLPYEGSERFFRAYLKYLIATKKYEQLIFFFTKVFNTHIGKAVYTSRNVKEYDIIQRAFDKFVEATVWTNIPFTKWADMVFDIIESLPNSYIAKWKVPAVDFVIDFEIRNEKEFYDFTFKNFSKYGIRIFDILLNHNVPEVAGKLVNFYLSGDFPEKRQVKNILKQHYQEVRNYIESVRKDFGMDNKTFVQMLLLFKQEKDVKEILKEIYQKEKDKEIKKLIVENIDISEPVSLSLTQVKKNSSRVNLERNQIFLSKNIKEFPELLFYNNEVADAKMKAYMLICYQNLCSTKASFELKYFSKLFQPKSLNNFCKYVFNLASVSNIVENEWAMCFVAQNITSNCAVEILKQMASLGKKYSQNMNYFAKLYIFEHKEEVLNIFNELDKEDNVSKIVLDVLLQCVIESNIYSYSEIENLRDKMVPNFDLKDCKIKISNAVISIERDWSVKLVGEQTKLALVEQKKLEREIERQTRRFYTAFLCGRMWTEENWERFVFGNSLINHISQTLLWGKYVEGNLVSVFKIEGDKLQNLVSVKTCNSQDYMIGIFHPVELSEADWSYIFDGRNSPFNQIYRDVYSLTNYNLHTSVVSRFNGFIVNKRTFFERMSHFGWKFSRETLSGNFISMQKICKELGLVAELNFSPVATNRCFDEGNLTLGELRFYRLTNVLVTGNHIITNKANSLELSALKDRYFSDMIYEITASGKK